MTSVFFGEKQNEIYLFSAVFFGFIALWCLGDVMSKEFNDEGRTFLQVVINETELQADTIDRVEDRSSGSNEGYMRRVRIYFKNGHELSVIIGNFSYGGNEGLFEIMPDDSSVFDEEDSGDLVAGHLTAERVKYYIDKIGSLSA